MTMITRRGQEFIIKDTHRGLWYEDGKLAKVVEAGRYKIPARRRWLRRRPTVECVLVDIRERDLTIKGQEILTADKVAIRVSILVQFRVTDAKAAVQTVEIQAVNLVPKAPSSRQTFVGSGIPRQRLNQDAASVSCTFSPTARRDYINHLRRVSANSFVGRC